MSTPLLIALGVLGALVLWTLVINVMDRRRNLPPGPFLLPIVGNLLALGETLNIFRSLFGARRKPSFLHDVLGDLSKIYGPITRVKLGQSLAIVISDPEMLREAFIKRAKKYSARPQTHNMRLTYNSAGPNEPMKGFVFNQGPAAKSLRDLIVQKLLKKSVVQTMTSIMRAEAASAILRIDERAESGEPLAVRPLCKAFSTNIITLAGFSERLWDRNDSMEANGKFGQLGEALETLTLHLGVPHMGDYVPWLRFMDWEAVREIHRCRKVRDPILQGLVRDHLATLDPERPRDIIDELLVSLGEGEVDAIAIVLAELYVTGSDTSAISIQWIIGLLMEHEAVQERLAEEIRSVVGAAPGDEPTEEHFARMPYLQAVLHEGMRYRTLVPLLIPHRTSEDDDLGGYHIPANTVVFGHWGRIARHASYGDPEAFRPERWLESGEMSKRQNETFLAFGYGPRKCAGTGLATEELQYALVKFMGRYRWRWTPELAADPDRLSASFSITSPSVRPIEALVTRR